MIPEVTIIDPHHPLRGERLKVLSLTCARGAGFIAVRLADGRRRLVRRAATDLDRPATAEPEAPRISVRTLLPLARHVRRMLAASQEGTPHADPNPPDPPSARPPGGASAQGPAWPAAVAGLGAPGPDAAGAADRPPARPAAPAPAPRRGGGAPC